MQAILYVPGPAFQGYDPTQHRAHTGPGLPSQPGAAYCLFMRTFSPPIEVSSGTCKAAAVSKPHDRQAVMQQRLRHRGSQRCLNGCTLPYQTKSPSCMYDVARHVNSKGGICVHCFVHITTGIQSVLGHGRKEDSRITGGTLHVRTITCNCASRHPCWVGGAVKWTGRCMSMADCCLSNDKFCACAVSAWMLAVGVVTNG